MIERLNWLSQYSYTRHNPGGDVETWICRDFRARLDVRVWAELFVKDNWWEDSTDNVEVSAGLIDDNLCLVLATIDNIPTADLEARLTWYEARVLAMLELGLNVTDGARPTAREKNPPCPSCGAELRTRLAQQCFNCGADWHQRREGPHGTLD